MKLTPGPGARFTDLPVLAAVALLTQVLTAADTPVSKDAPAAAPGAAKKERPFTPGGKWRAGDLARPKPRVVDPGTGTPGTVPGRAPADAIVLFDGKDLAQWQTAGKTPGPAKWKVENGYMEIVPKGGSIVSRERFGSAQIHIEWATPTEVKGSSQGRGNSGVILQGHGEIQVLDSWQNDTYADGQAGAIYGKYPPLVNVARKPGEWQCYDILFDAPRSDAQGKVVNPARLTVLHNGVVVQHAVETGGSQPETQLLLQDHNNPIRYRNIWIRKLRGYDEP